MVGMDEFMASIEHAVEVNEATSIDMRTVQFNIKLNRTASQEKNLPLPPCKMIIPLSHTMWDKMKPGSDINTQMLWDANFVTPVHSPQCALVKQVAIL